MGDLDCRGIEVVGVPSPKRGDRRAGLAARRRAQCIMQAYVAEHTTRIGGDRGLAGRIVPTSQGEGLDRRTKGRWWVQGS
jgi:hypothetical protein